MHLTGTFCTEIATTPNRAIPAIERRDDTRTQNNERGIWQRRFWEHTIRDEHDFQKHLDYVHYNPVKHGHVARVRDWQFSTFHEHVKRGVYPIDWTDAPNMDEA